MSELLIKSKNLRIFLNNYFYSQNDIITKLLSFIGLHFNVFNIYYDSSLRRIDIRIKKSEMKRNSGYSHDSHYYTSIFNNILILFFDQNSDFLAPLFKDENLNKDNLDFQDLSNPQLVSLTYNLLTANDNIITIYL